MATKLSERDFEVLRRPLESGRQSPGALGGIFIVSVFFQAMMYSLEYFVAGSATIYPNKDEILKVHFWFTLGLIVLSLVYSIPAVYKRSGKIQYFLSILVTQNLFSIPFFICAIFLVGNDGYGEKPSPESLLNFTYITLGIGILIFLVTFVRFYILLRNGHYRKGSKKDEIRSKFEKTSYIPAAIIAGIGLVFIIQFIARNSAVADLNGMVFIVIGISLFFVMLFILPEQLVILYCKVRYKSFNFNERGYLNK